MKNIIAIAIILTALSLQAQVAPIATNADNLGGIGATDYMTISGGADTYLPKSSTGPVIDQNVDDIADLQTNLTVETTTRQYVDSLIADATAQNKTDLGTETTDRQTADSLIGGTTQELRVDVDDNSERIESLAATSHLQYLYSTADASSSEYFASSTTPQSAAATNTKTLSGTGVIVSSWVIDMGGIDTIPSGGWHVEFYAKVNNVNATRVWFDIYDGTGAALTNSLIMSTALSPELSQVVEEYFVRITTNLYVVKTEYFSVVMKANEVGPNPLLSYSMGGEFDMHVQFPVIRAEVSVTKIIPGTNMNATPSNGLGEVTINLNANPKVESIEASVEGSFNTVVSSGNIYANKDVVHGRADANTKLDFGDDQIALVAGSKDVIRGIEAAVDTICVGDGTWDYMIFGDTTNYINEITTYTYSTKLWSMINLAVRYGVRASSFRFTIGGTIDAGGTITGDPNFINKPLTITMGSSSTDDFNTNEYANDSACLRAALTYLSTGTTSGGTIQVKDGAFTFMADNGMIETQCENVRLTGNGKGTNFIWDDNAGGDRPFYVRHSGFSMDNIYHTTIADESSLVAITFSSANVILTNLSVSNCWFETDSNGTATFLGFSNCKMVKINKNDFKAVGSASSCIGVTNSSDVVISNNIAEGDKDNPVWIFVTISGERITVSKNILTNIKIRLSGGNGIDICTIENNIIDLRNMSLDDIPRGIDIALNKVSNDIQIVGNTIVNGAYGIDQTLSSANIDNITIVGNRIDCSTGVALASDGRYCQIQGNNFKDCNVDIQDAGTGTQITNNIDENGNKDRNPMVGIELDLTSGATIQGLLNVQSMSSGETGSADQVWTQHASSPSWSDAAAGGGGGGAHNISWHITGYPFDSDTTDTGLYQKPTAIAGTITEVYCKFRVAPTESFDIRFKDTALISSAYDNIFGTVTFTAGISSASVTGLSLDVHVGDSIGIDMYNIDFSSNAGQDLGITVKLEE